MPKQKLDPFETDRVILRLLEITDLPLTLSWRNQDHIRSWFLKTDVINEKSHLAWFKKYSDLDNDFVFMILAKDLDNSPIGQISLYSIDWDAGIAEFGRLMIGEPFAQGKGYAKEATRLLLHYSFTKLEIKQIHLEVKENNEPAIAIYKSIGFIETTRNDGLVFMVARHEASQWEIE